MAWANWSEIEDAYVYPMLKSSNVANRRQSTGSRFMLVTQTSGAGAHGSIYARGARKRGPTSSRMRTY